MSLILTIRKWLAAFLFSHLVGWIVAHLQAKWIVKEVRKTKEDLKQLLTKI